MNINDDKKGLLLGQLICLLGGTPYPINIINDLIRVVVISVALAVSRDGRMAGSSKRPRRMAPRHAG